VGYWHALSVDEVAALVSPPQDHHLVSHNGLLFGCCRAFSVAEAAAWVSLPHHKGRAHCEPHLKDIIRWMEAAHCVYRSGTELSRSPGDDNQVHSMFFSFGLTAGAVPKEDLYLYMV